MLLQCQLDQGAAGFVGGDLGDMVFCNIPSVVVFCLAWITFLAAVYLEDHQHLTGFDLFHIAFQKDSSIKICRLQYNGKVSPETKTQFRQYMTLIELDAPTWALVWNQWRQAHAEKTSRSWEDDQRKYLEFAKFINNLESDLPTTADELARLETMLLNVKEPEEPVLIDFFGTPVTLEEGDLALATSTNMLTLYWFMLFFVVIKVGLFIFTLSQSILNK